MKESIRLRSGATVPQVSYREAQAKNYLDRATLKLMHLTPDGAPAAYSEGKSGGVVFWFDPEKLTETERKYGRITKRAVIYRGSAYLEENGVEYINVESYLNSLQ